MATRKRTTAKRTTILKNSAKPTTNRRKRTAISSRKKGSSNNIANFLVPFVFIVVILFGLGFLLFKGYQTVTASSFFDVKKIEIRGTSRVSKDEIEKIIRSEAEKNGVWNSRLEEIKAEIEKMSFVKSAVVSRLLPDGIVVRVNERTPRTIVRLGSGDFWTDDEAILIGKVEKNDSRPSFVLRGWDETKSEKAQKDNQERIKLFLKIQDEWQTLGIDKRVIALNLSDLQDVQAIVQDSASESVSVFLGKEDFGKRLQKAITVLEGKAEPLESLYSRGGNVVAKPKNS